jgi:hypothetical protein
MGASVIPSCIQMSTLRVELSETVTNVLRIRLMALPNRCLEHHPYAPMQAVRAA